MYGERVTIGGRFAAIAIGVIGFFAPGLTASMLAKKIRENPEHFPWQAIEYQGKIPIVIPDTMAKAKKSKAAKKMASVMHEQKAGGLHSGKGGPVVKSRQQAIAIALSESKKQQKERRKNNGKTKASTAPRIA